MLRNAGARASDDAIRSLIKSTIQLGVDRIAVVHHTDCGAAKIQLDDAARSGSSSAPATTRSTSTST